MGLGSKIMNGIGMVTGIKPMAQMASGHKSRGSGLPNGAPGRTPGQTVPSSGAPSAATGQSGSTGGSSSAPSGGAGSTLGSTQSSGGAFSDGGTGKWYSRSAGKAIESSGADLSGGGAGAGSGSTGTTGTSLVSGTNGTNSLPSAKKRNGGLSSNGSSLDAFEQ